MQSRLFQWASTYSIRPKTWKPLREEQFPSEGKGTPKPNVPGPHLPFASQPNTYTNGIGGGSANYLVQVTVQTNAIPNLSSISVEVSTPAQGALGSRSRFGFLTMIGNRQ